MALFGRGNCKYSVSFKPSLGKVTLFNVNMFLSLARNESYPFRTRAFDSVQQTSLFGHQRLRGPSTDDSI